jgi:branched-chain amino acid transport system permease protein
MILQQLINGLSIGSIYALMAVGYSLIYSLMNFTNFAHGVVVMLSAYIGYYSLLYISHNNLIALVLALLLGGIISVLIEITTYRPLLLKNAKRLYLVIAGLGLTIVAENLIIITITGRCKPYPLSALASITINIFGYDIGLIDLIILIISMIALIALEFYLKYSRDGLAIRSASFSLDITSLMGVNVDKLMMKVFLIAGFLAGIAGFFLGMKYTAYPQLDQLTTKAFISAVLGGLGSLTGSVLGALILGVSETFVSGYISSSMRDIFTFSLLVIVLLFRPTGLMGKSSEDKA